MQRANLILLFSFFGLCSFAQLDSNSVYSNLPISKTYLVNTSSQSDGYNTSYSANGKSVSKATYDKFNDSWNQLPCPAILRNHDETDVLVSEGVFCSDCGVGYYTEFHPNGTLKLKGQYRENPTGNWIDIYGRGFCSVPDGDWLYYNEFEELYYIERWDNGVFLEQKPDSKKPEIWKVDLQLHGNQIDTQSVRIADFQQLRIIPYYKNATEDPNLSLKISCSKPRSKLISKELNLKDFPEFDINEMIEAMETTEEKSEFEKINVRIELYSAWKLVRAFTLNLTE